MSVFQEHFFQERRRESAEVEGREKGGNGQEELLSGPQLQKKEDISSLCFALSSNNAPTPRPLGPQSRRHLADVWWAFPSGLSSCGWDREAARARCQSRDGAER